MISGIREKTVVKENGTVEVSAPDLPVGTKVEVIILVESETDTTEYLLSTEANRQHLSRAIRDAEDPAKHIRVEMEGWKGFEILI